MKLMELLNSEELSATEKIDRLGAIVDAARAAYGNQDVEVEVPFVSTTEGNIRLNMLTPADKVAVATQTIGIIAADCIEYGEENKAIILDKSIEEAIAIHPVLINLEADSGSKYL